MNQKNQIYLYYSTNKLEYVSSEVSSLLGVINNETDLVISPKQEEVKKRDKKKKKSNLNKRVSPLSSPINSVLKGGMSPSSSLLSNKYSSLDKARKSLINKVKIFKESPLDEPFMLESKLLTETGGSKDKDGLDFEILSMQKTTFEEVNSEVKKRYKSYDKEDNNDEIPQYDYKPLRETCCEWLGRIIAETRSPSALLSLSILIQGVINEKMLQGIIDSNNSIKMERMGLDKCSLLHFRNNTHSIEFIDKETQELFAKTQIQTIQRFNCETIIVSISLLVILVVIYFVSIFTFLK